MIFANKSFLLRQIIFGHHVSLCAAQTDLLVQRRGVLPIDLFLQLRPHRSKAFFSPSHDSVVDVHRWEELDSSMKGLTFPTFGHPPLWSAFTFRGTDAGSSVSVRRTFSHVFTLPEACLCPVEFATSLSPSCRLPVFEGEAGPLFCARMLRRAQFRFVT